MRRFLSIFLAFVLAAGAQQIGQNSTGAAATTTFTVNSQLVVETVSVRDKSGKPVEGLKASDFTVTEDGAPQTIKLFEYQRLEEPAADAPPPAPVAATPLARLPHSYIAPEA